MNMRTGLLLMLAIAAATALTISLQSAVAHNWVPRYDGNKWGQACLAPNGPRRVSPATCCNQARALCVSACGLADIDDGWKNACRANCESAGNACLARVQTLPPVGGVPGERPPASTN
ncbi:MAG: hypothetical protein K8S25_13830 [Alphaproteobacteria bacterium]|nr:hypothetical protein [Alphaproteobacteria bacterium]